jgi:hypothetical protein
MTTVRRWYLFGVCAISLQSVAWALIALLRNLIVNQGTTPTLQIAFSISVILIGMPIYLAHWLWEQKLSERDTEERSSLLRRIYLYGMMAGFLLPFLINAFTLLERLVAIALNQTPLAYQLPHTTEIAQSILALIPLSLFWFYHYRQTQTDEGLLAPGQANPAVRRLYILFFSALGVLMACFNSANLIRWLLMQIGRGQITVDSGIRLSPEIAWIVVSIPVWLIHWEWAQRLFAGPAQDEKASGLRKFYLYALVFIGVLGVVINLTVMLAGLLRRILGLTPEGDLRDVVSVAIVLGVLWAYHAIQLQRDAQQASEAPQQATIRRLYRYLVAGIGLVAFLLGLGGDISVLIRALAGGPLSLLKEQLAWFTAALVAGLPVWFLPWRKLQSEANQPDAVGFDECRSIVRRIYLYLFIFAATMTMLGCAIVIVYRLLSTLLGEKAITISELTQAIAFALIALGVWLYHGLSIRQDSARLQQVETERLSALLVLVWPDEVGLAERIVVAARSIHGIAIELASPGEELTAQIAAAGVIVLPWTIYLPESGIPTETLQSIAASPARKLLLPRWPEGWDWAGMERGDETDIARYGVKAIKQILTGEHVRPGRALGPGAIVAITIGALILFVITTSILSAIVENFSL